MYLEASLKKARHRIMKLAFRVSLGILIITVFLLNFDPSSISIILDNLTTINVVIASIFIVLSTLPTLIRWVFIAKKNYISSSAISLINYYYAGFLFNAISPANLGGDLYKFVSVKKDTINSNQDIVNILLHERVYGLISLFLIVCMGFLASQNHISFINGLWYEIAFTSACLTLLLILFFKKNAIAKLNKIKFLRPILSYINFNRANFIYDINVLLLSFLGFFLWAVSIFIICYELNMNLSFSNILIISALVEIIRFIPLTFQGIGVREPSFALLASEFFGSNFEVAFLAGLIIYACLSLVNLSLGAIFYFFSGLKH